MPYKQNLQGVSVTTTTVVRLTLPSPLSPPASVPPLPQAPVLTP